MNLPNVITKVKFQRCLKAVNYTKGKWGSSDRKTPQIRHGSKVQILNSRIYTRKNQRFAIFI